jgi:hypothetical protein
MTGMCGVYSLVALAAQIQEADALAMGWPLVGGQ